MPERRVILHQCKNCGFSMEYPAPEPVTIPVKEPCKCGMTEMARINQFWSRVMSLALFLVLSTSTAGCWIYHHYETERVRLMPEKFKATNKPSSEGIFPALNPTERVVEKTDQEIRAERIERLLNELQNAERGGK